MRVQAEENRIAMRDGVRLAADVVRPEGAGPRPALVTRTPYGRAGSRLADDVVGLARAGWAVVVQDVRGRGGSDGEFDPFHQEVEDGADTIGWCRAQSWCDGRVAMFGASYRGATQWLAACARPSGLAAIAPTLTTAAFGEGWTFEGGIPAYQFLRSWALRFATSGSAPGPDAERRALLLADRPFPAVDDGAEVSELFPPLRSWLDPAADRWARVDVLADPPPVAGFHTAGWYDQFCEGGLAAYTAAVERHPELPQRLVVGPWSHSTYGARVVGESHMGAQADADRIDLAGRRYGWLAAALDPRRRDEVTSGACVFMLGAGEWRELAAWPPPASPYRLFLTPEGRLADAPEPGTRTVRHDPADPAPSAGGRSAGFWPLSGPVDQRAVERRPDVLCYTSEPLTRDLEVIGVIRARLFVTADRPDAEVVLRVCDVHPDGRSYNIVEQGHRLRNERSWFEAGSTAWHLHAGHRIRIHVASASWPRLMACHRPFGLRIDHGPAAPSVLDLPVVAC